jgi:hypothetical protein
MSVMTAETVPGMIPVIVVVAHPEDRTDDHSRQDHQGHRDHPDRQAWE